jgi:Arc/MetJ-type ribon-helix-helix transcriptional regulator
MVTIANLPKETEAKIQQLIETGDFSNPESVIVSAVDDFIRRRAEAEHLRALIQVGIDQADRGELVEWTPELRQQIWDEARRRAASGEPLDSDVQE